jgi:hypothetical protein
LTPHYGIVSKYKVKDELLQSLINFHGLSNKHIPVGLNVMLSKLVMGQDDSSSALMAEMIETLIMEQNASIRRVRALCVAWAIMSEGFNSATTQLLVQLL